MRDSLGFARGFQSAGWLPLQFYLMPDWNMKETARSRSLSVVLTTVKDRCRRRRYLAVSTLLCIQPNDRFFCLSFCGSPAVFQSRFHAYAMHGSGPFPLSTLKGSYNKIFNPEMLH
jgi:hypothetical protein